MTVGTNRKLSRKASTATATPTVTTRASGRQARYDTDAGVLPRRGCPETQTGLFSILSLEQLFKLFEIAD